MLGYCGVNEDEYIGGELEMEAIELKEMIKNKMDERLKYILGKNVENITNEEFSILSTKLFKLEQDENKEERDKEFVELISKLFTK